MKTEKIEKKTSTASFIQFTHLQNKISPLSGPMLQEKAVEFLEMFTDETEKFITSKG